MTWNSRQKSLQERQGSESAATGESATHDGQDATKRDAVMMRLPKTAADTMCRSEDAYACNLGEGILRKKKGFAALIAGVRTCGCHVLTLYTVVCCGGVERGS